MNADTWLMHSSSKGHIAEEDSTRVHCRFGDDVEMYCGIISNVIGYVSPTQVLLAGISYDNYIISEFNRLKELRSQVINDGNWSAIRYITLHRQKNSMFPGKQKTVRIARALRDKVSEISTDTGIYSSDIYLMQWWFWFSDFIELDNDLNYLKNDRRVIRSLNNVEDVKDDLKDEIIFLERFLG